jgi:23S rRNA (cytosine1962-C5)-methyltransferase
MVSFQARRPAEDWIGRRIADAWSLRKVLSLDSDALRVVNAEGDFIPGLIVDLYGSSAVVSVHTRGIEALVEPIAARLGELVPGVNVYLRRDEHYARVEGLVRQSGYLAGSGNGMSTIREGTVQFLVDFREGQKTGFYLDQRENRRIIASASRGRTVLNLFSYTGAVALEAAAAGASRVVSVESSARAIEMSRQNHELNPRLRECSLSWIQSDVFTFLEDPGVYDIVVADPPPFARRRAELAGALAGYLSLFQQCIRVLSPGGLAFFFSCSGAVDRPTFRDVVSEAGRRCGRNVRLLRELHADSDHPVASTHPEGEYLKGWMIHAD